MENKFEVHYHGYAKLYISQNFKRFQFEKYIFKCLWKLRIIL